MIHMLLVSALAIIAWELGKAISRRLPWNRPKGLRFPNGIPRVSLEEGQVYDSGPVPIALFRAEEAVAVFSDGTRVEGAPGDLQVSMPLRGGSITVKDHGGTHLWGVSFKSKDRDAQ